MPKRPPGRLPSPSTPKAAEDERAGEWATASETVKSPPGLVQAIERDAADTSPHKIVAMELAESEKVRKAAYDEGYQAGFAAGASADFIAGLDAHEMACRLYLYAEGDLSLAAVDAFIEKIKPFIKSPT